MPSNFTIRPATLDDIPEILRQRRGMYEDMHYTDAEAISAMLALTEDYLKEALPEGSFRAWLAHDGPHAVGGGALVITPWPAHPYDLECRRATILNVYTYREYRRRGIARAVMQTIVDWCRQRGLARVTLHASEDGRPLYESMGFEASNEMRLSLR